MHHHCLNPSRFLSLPADQQPSRPKRFESKSKSPKQDERWGGTSPNTVCETIAWSPICEPSVDRPPVCPRRSVSPKRSSKKPIHYQGRLIKFLSFVVDLDVTDADKHCTRVTSTFDKKKNTVKQHLNLVPSSTLEEGRSKPFYKRFTDKTPVFCRPPLSPLQQMNHATQSRLRKGASSARFEDLSSISFSDLDLTDMS